MCNWINIIMKKLFGFNLKEGENSMKLWLVTLQGMNTAVNSAPHGKAYILANDPKEASERLLSYVKDNNLGFTNERELKSVELIAEADDLYPKCGMRLFL